MKKLYSTPEWRRYSKHRQENEEARRRRSEEAKRSRNRSRQGRRRIGRRPRRKVELQAPAVFSMLKNPEEMCAFFHQLHQENERRHQVLLDFSGVTDLTADGVAVLLARVNSGQRTGVSLIRGNIPSDPRVLGLLIQSGFFEHVHASRGQLPEAQAVAGRIYKQSSFEVEGEAAQDLIFRVAREMLGQERYAKGVYSTLIELMGNTHEHAGGPGEDAGQEQWWMTAWLDPVTRQATFAFVDEGVGIFQSVHLRRALRTLRRLGLKTNAAVLRDMLEGVIEGSRTGLPHRGNGLPNIHRRQKQGGLENLVIITNDVLARVSDDDYRRLQYGFRGTFYCWQAGESQYGPAAVDSEGLQQDAGTAPS